MYVFEIQRNKQLTVSVVLSSRTLSRYHVITAGGRDPEL